MVFEANPNNGKRPLGKYIQQSTLQYKEKKREVNIAWFIWIQFITHKSKSKLKNLKTASVFEAKLLSIIIQHADIR